MTSKNETTNFQIHEFKVMHRSQRALLNPFIMLYLHIIHHFKKHFKPCYFVLKKFYRTLNSWIGKFVVSFYDVTNRLIIKLVGTLNLQNWGCFGKSWGLALSDWHPLICTSLTNRIEIFSEWALSFLCTCISTRLIWSYAIS